MNKLLYIKKFLLIIGILTSFTQIGVGYAQLDITVSGRWRLTIDDTDMLGGAGSDLNSTYESDPDEVTVRIRNRDVKPSEYWAWHVDIHRIDGNWPSGFHLDIRRTGDGVGDGTITGLGAYEEIDDNPASPYPSFSGTYDRRLIPMQFRLRDVSLQVPPDDYDTSVVYTLVED